MFESYYTNCIGVNPINDVTNILCIRKELEEKIKNKDFSIIHFDGEEFMKFHKYCKKVYLEYIDDDIFGFQIYNNYYVIMSISLQVNYLINEINNVSSNVIEKEYHIISKKIKILPLETICNFFCI